VHARARATKFAVPVLVFLLALGVLTLANRPAGESASAQAFDAGALPEDTGELIEAIQRRISTGADAATYAQLGEAYLQRSSETGNPRFNLLAEDAFAEALRRDPDELTATIGAGTLAMNRHDFRRGFRLGLRARRIAPQVVRSYAVLVDGQLELGRYEAARRSLQDMIDAKPNLASYARVSYYRELTGDLPGAIEAMRLAVSAAANTGRMLAVVQTLLGDLHMSAGRVSAARRIYRAVLTLTPAYAPAEAGLAAVSVALDDLPAAERRLEAVVNGRYPAPENLIFLAEIQLVRGMRAEAIRNLERAKRQERLLIDAGATSDAGVVILEADHGDPDLALQLGREVARAAPSVSSHDALGWALTMAGRPAEGLAFARRALRLGSVDPAFHYHAGMAAAAAQKPSLARRELRLALQLNPGFSPWHARRARATLQMLRRSLRTGPGSKSLQ
jgi:tetratricopeptide (TPR) repeat protein